MLTDQQIERIRETFLATGVARKAIDRVGRPHRAAARAYINEALRHGFVPRKMKERQEKEPLFRGVLSPGELIGSRQELPPKGQIKRYLLTCAQNNTVLHADAWRNLLALKEHYDAELLVGRIMYDRRVDRKNQKTGSADPLAEIHSGDIVYAPEIEPYIFDSPTELAPGLHWHGEVNVIATATQPLSGFEGFGEGGSIIIPHTRIAMQSWPRMGKRPEPRFGYTTGAVTAINYIPRKAGQKAAFAHCYGALLVEVNSDGEWWVRQVQADKDGVLCDLNLRVENGVVSAEPENVEAVVFGDMHVEVADDEALAAAALLVRELVPRHQVFHDVLDFRARNHHDRGHPMTEFRKHVADKGSVEDEVERVALFLKGVAGQHQGDGKVWVVDSNHDRAMTRWLDETDYRDDPENAIYYLKLQLARYKAASEGRRLHLLEHACREFWIGSMMDIFIDPPVKFLSQDDSLTFHGIECGMHGDRGIDGRRGSPAAYAKMESKVVVGHSHSASIYAGVFTAGTTSKLRLGYTKGPSTWSHSHVLIYANGQRTIITSRGERPWA